MSGKVVTAEAALQRFNLQPNAENTKPPWHLSGSDLKLANERLKQISIPSYLDFKATHVFSHPVRLKSHDWKQVKIKS